MAKKRRKEVKPVEAPKPKRTITRYVYFLRKEKIIGLDQRLKDIYKVKN